MKKVGTYDNETLTTLDNFLAGIFAGIEDESYLMVFNTVPDGKGSVYLSDKAIGYLKTHDDHDCTATSEDGCSFCYMLQLLHILPDGEYNPEGDK